MVFSKVGLKLLGGFGDVIHGIMVLM